MVDFYFLSPSMSPTTPTLAALRKKRGLSQEELGRAIARRLNTSIGITYAQKKIAKFESGDAAPTEEEIGALAEELGVEIEVVQSAIAGRAPHEATSLIDQFAVSGGAFSEPATCTLSRPRTKSLDETSVTMKQAIEKQNVSVAVFYSAIRKPPPASATLPDHAIRPYPPGE